ncbi:MAG: hypothetical protein ACREMF_11415 [Gemmatimonadales bacterium]
MSWWLAGLIGGVAAYLADWVLWGKVFTKGMEAFATPPPAGQPVNMGPMLAKAAALALAFGVLLACLYDHFKGVLWFTHGGGPLAGMELATALWLPTIALATLGSGVWFDKVRPLFWAQFWAWLVRMNVAGLVVGLLLK